MSLQDELISLESQFWTSGPDFYREHVDERCLLAFDRMAGALSREEVAQTVTGSRFRDPEVRVEGLIQPTADFAVLTYRANAKRSSGEPYSALVSSGYVRRDGHWKLAFHQHTPS